MTTAETDKIAGTVDQIDLLRLNLVMRLYDREVLRKEMLEKSAYFLITVLGILVSAGLLQAKSVAEVATFIKSQVGYITFLVLFIGPFFLFICLLLLSVFQATRLRTWHSGMPPNLYEILYNKDLSDQTSRIVEIILLPGTA
jgi:hypothetical protein